MGRKKLLLKREPVDGTLFGKRMRSIRVSKNISIQALAITIGCGRNYITQLEKGTRTPSFDTLIMVCNTLKVCPNELLRDYLIDEERTKIRVDELSKVFSELPEREQNHLERLLSLCVDYWKKENLSKK